QSESWVWGDDAPANQKQPRLRGNEKEEALITPTRPQEFGACYATTDSSSIIRQYCWHYAVPVPVDLLPQLWLNFKIRHYRLLAISTRLSIGNVSALLVS